MSKATDVGVSKVVSVRFDADTYKRLEAYAMARDTKVSPAVRELCVRGLAADGLELYGGEVAQFMRSVANETVSGLDEILERRFDEQEDRIARVVSRAAKASSVGSLASIDIARALYEGLRRMPPEDVWAIYARRAGEMQAGSTFKEALERGKS